MSGDGRHPETPSSLVLASSYAGWAGSLPTGRSPTARRALGELEPTGRRATFSAVNIFRFENGKVAEIWNHRDDLGLREQLGVAVHAGARPEG